MIRPPHKWFAWHPVELGALPSGKWVWLRTVWRVGHGCLWGTIYQPLEKK